MVTPPPIRTPDQRLRVFVSSTLQELAPERQAVREAIEALRLSPVMFELGARPHPPRELYRAYLDQSQVFVGVYWERYGWVAPGEDVSGLEDEYRLAGDRPRLLYLKAPADREPRLDELVARFQADDRASYRTFTTAEELRELVTADLALLLSERFEGDGTVTPAGEPGPLPLPLTPTLGRDALVDAVVERLEAGDRLVSLTGPGGVGKTRVGLDVARRMTEGGRPVWLVPLAAVRAADLVLPEVAERIGARVEGRLDLATTVARALGGRGAVLVLDNLEQVDGAGSVVLGLLQAVPDLGVVVTSRRPLRVDGEHEVRLGPLPVPESEDPGPGESAALDLFVERATAVNPAFTLTGGNRRCVIELVRRLDGLPLAIELVAARTRVLTPEQILERLGGRLDLDAGVERPDRQRSLRATIDWSHDLLDGARRDRFAELAVFAGGWTLEAAEAVTNGGQATADDLAALLDHSLVQPAGPAGGAPRFEMLETVRQFARERLAGDGAEGRLQRRHLDWFAALGDEAQPFLCGPHQDTWVRRIDPERANLREAVANALVLGDHRAVIELTWDVIVLYFVRDAVHEPDRWLGAVAAADPELDDVGRAKLRSLHALTRIHHGDREGAWDALTWSLDVFDDQGMDFEAAVTLKELAFLRFDAGDPAGAVRDLETSSTRFEALGHDWGIALDETMLGSLHAAVDDPERAEAHHRRALHHAEAIGNQPLMSQALGQLALVRAWEGDVAGSLGLLGDAATLVRAGRFRVDAAACLDATAGVALARGRPDVARTALRRARQERDALGVVLWPTVSRFVDSLWEDAGSDGSGAATEGDLFDVLDDTLDAVRRAG